MLSTSRDVSRIDSQIMANNYTFDTVKEFTTKNDVRLEIKRRIIFANRCYYSFNRQLSSRDLSPRAFSISNKCFTTFLNGFQVSSSVLFMIFFKFNILY